MLGINRYGASGPGEQLIDAFGFNVANIVGKYNSLWQMDTFEQKQLQKKKPLISVVSFLKLIAKDLFH